MRRRVKRDSNHKSLARDLERQGVEVIDLSAAGELPDLLCQRQSFVAFIEVKPEGRGTYTTKQLAFLGKTRVPAAICKTVDEAMNFMRTGNGLSPKQKNDLLAFCATTDKAKVNSEIIERVLNA